MKLKDMISTYIGDTITAIIQIDINDDNKEIVKEIVKEVGDANTINIIQFKNNKALAYVDLNADGYRSGDWYLAQLEKLLDQGNTKTLKILNEVVKDIRYIANDDGNQLLIETDTHVIAMGQDQSEAYYPKNFFSIEDCRKFALGEHIDMEET